MELEIIPINLPLQSPEAQRTEKWYNDRWGKITSSCLDKLFTAKGIGQGGITYLNGILYQRYCGKPSQLQIENMERGNSWETKEGTKYEPEARKLLSQKIGYEITEVEFKDYPGFEGQAGDSADGVFVYHGLIIPVELKCTMKAETTMVRRQKVTEKHQDFWQCQGHILAYNAPFMVYAVYDYATDNEDMRISYQVVMPCQQEKLISTVKQGVELVRNAYINNLMSVNDELVNYSELRMLPKI